MERLVDIDLIKKSFEKDKIGQQKEVTTVTNKVLGVLSSVSRVEWASASQLGLQAECVAVLANSDDYCGESYADINGTRYTIYRTYLTNDGGIELYLRKDTGPNL